MTRPVAPFAQLTEHAQPEDRRARRAAKACADCGIGIRQGKRCLPCGDIRRDEQHKARLKRKRAEGAS